MREELLAHVTAVFEEEAAKPGEERPALERTEQRFGDPAGLTAQLQESAPAGDRWARLLEHVFVGTGASTLRLALRYTSFPFSSRGPLSSSLTRCKAGWRNGRLSSPAPS